MDLYVKEGNRKVQTDSTVAMNDQKHSIHSPYRKSLGCNVRVCLAYGMVMSLSLGCGAVGKPIPPEDVGIEAKIRKQGQKAQTEPGEPLTEEPIPITEQPEELPPLYPIGVR